MTEQKMEIILEADDNGGYKALAPVLPGCTAHGKTVEEALDNMKKEVKVYVEALIKDVFVNAKKQGLA
jgi:predicted RNase H-like HicB family nuclease